jgi:DNA invertase Pin-like site-specific DNA recombinase
VASVIAQRSLEQIRNDPKLYGRASRFDQNLELQLAALKSAGCHGVFTDKISGARIDRPALKEALSHLRRGDTLVVWKLDRLGRSVKRLVELVSDLERQEIHFHSITDGIDTKTPEGLVPYPPYRRKA